MEQKRKKWPIVAIVIVGLCIVVATMVVYTMQNTLTKVENIIVRDVGLHEAHISWDAVKNATSYEVCIFEKGGEQILFTEETDTTEIEVDNLSSNHEYEVTVMAYKERKQNRIESEVSDKVQVQTLIPEIGKIQEIQAITQNTESILVEWKYYDTTDINTDGTDVNILYTILGLRKGDDTYVTLADNLEQTKYLHNELAELEIYSYKIIVQEEMDGAFYFGQESDVSATAITGISTIGGLRAEGISSSEIEISWDAYIVEKTNEDGTPVSVSYTIYASDSEDGEFVVLEENITETSFIEKELSPEITRYYKVAVMAKRDGHDVVGEQSVCVNASTQVKKDVVNNVGGNSNQNIGSENAGGNGNENIGSENADGNVNDNVDDGNESENVEENQKPQSSEQSEKDAQARVVAQQIANSITGSTDLERVRKAAQIVEMYCMNATYTSSDPDYRTPYGLFCKGVYTCAGATRSLGLVLECMGYSWKHVNENQWSHQWCELTMDGQTGWADGMGGIADYGACPFATGDSYTDENGITYFAP